MSRVRFIKQAQAVGLTLRDIGVLVKSRRNTTTGSCKRIRAVLAQRIGDIEQKMQEMAAFRQVLQDHLSACDRALADHSDECPTLEAIERGPSSRAAGATR